MRTTPPGPKGEPVFGNSRQYATDPFRFLSACAEAYGDVVHFDLGPLETYMLTNPDDIETVLVGDARTYRKPEFQDDALGDLLGKGLLLSDGETWERQRELANPAFAMSRVAGFADRIVDYAEAMLAGWTAGEQRDLEDEMTRVTLNVIVDLMLGIEPTDDRMARVQESLEPLGARFEPDPLRFVLPDWVPTAENRKYEAAIGVMEDVIDDIVAERAGTIGREGDPDAPMDLLSILLRARGRGEQTRRQLRDEVMTMLLAGHDTTALTLTYTWYLLSRHPGTERRLHEEVDAVLDGRPAMAEVRDLEYTEAVINEAMRLYPPVYLIFREPKVDVKLGGYRIPEGKAIMLPQWVVHRSERYWEDPETFDPARWLDGREEGRPRFAYFPFGGGPRHCIGRHLAMLEAKLIIASVARNYRLEYAGEGPVDLRASLTAHPLGGMPMRVRERT